MSTETLSSAQPQTAPQATAFSHPRLQELMKKAQEVPGVGAIVLQVIGDLVHPQDRVLACYYQFEANVGKTPGDQSSNFYSCELILVTAAYFISVNIFPKNHTYRKKKIHTVSEVQMRYDPPSISEIKGVQVGKFLPNNLSMSVNFNDDKGNQIEGWQIESTHPESIRNLMEISRILNRCVGFPLSQLAGATQSQGNA